MPSDFRVTKPRGHFGASSFLAFQHPGTLMVMSSLRAVPGGAPCLGFCTPLPSALLPHAAPGAPSGALSPRLHRLHPLASGHLLLGFRPISSRENPGRTPVHQLISVLLPVFLWNWPGPPLCCQPLSGHPLSPTVTQGTRPARRSALSLGPLTRLSICSGGTSTHGPPYPLAPHPCSPGAGLMLVPLPWERSVGIWASAQPLSEDS